MMILETFSLATYISVFNLNDLIYCQNALNFIHCLYLYNYFMNLLTPVVVGCLVPYENKAVTYLSSDQETSLRNIFGNDKHRDLILGTLKNIFAADDLIRFLLDFYQVTPIL